MYRVMQLECCARSTICWSAIPPVVQLGWLCAMFSGVVVEDQCVQPVCIAITRHGAMLTKHISAAITQVHRSQAPVCASCCCLVGSVSCLCRVGVCLLLQPVQWRWTQTC